MSADTPDPWIDARLRQVPLPAGLLARLRQGTLPDDQLDASLRAVNLPHGLRDSLRGIPADLELDRRVRAVACPQPLKARLKEIVANEELDEQIRDVPYPAWLAVSVRAVWQVPHKNRYAQWAQALALMLLVGLAYSLGMAAMLYDTFLPGSHASRVAASQRDLNFELQSLPPEPAPVLYSAARVAPQESADEEPILISERSVAAGDALPTGLADQALYDNAYMQLLGTDILRLWQPGILGQPLREDDVLPELVVVRQPMVRGIEPPLFRGFDYDQLMLEGVQPIIALEGQEYLESSGGLTISRPPLWTDAEGYERARSEILAGSLPAPNSIHPEDFLAAGEYDFLQPSQGELAIRTAAGPAVFGDGQSIMLMVGVQAGPARTQRTEPTHMVVAVDTSNSMDWGHRLDLTRQALRQILDQMRPEDRLTLVGFSEQVEVLAEAAAPSERERILAAIDRLQLGQGTHAVAGLQKATSLAMATPPEFNMALEVVLITDGLGELPADIRAATTEMMSLAAEEGVRWTVLDLGRPGHASRNLETLATASGGRHLRTTTAEEIGWNLVETMTGGSSLVAQDANLTVQFNSDSVLKYRLVGHVPSAAGFQSAKNASLRGGQSAVVLYEVWLRPGNDDPLVATATLKWQDAQIGDSHRADTQEGGQMRKQEISRTQVALSAETTALPLTLAQLLAESAEILARSPYVSDDRNFSSVISYAQSMNPRVQSRPSYQHTLEMIRAAANLPRGG